MRALLPLLILVLFGFTATGTTRDGERELRITTSATGSVVVDDLTGQGRTVIMAGPQVSIALGEEAIVRVNDLDSPFVVARLDKTNGWVIWQGSFEIEVIRDKKVEGRFLVQDATIVLGQFAGSEGWTR